MAEKNLDAQTLSKEITVTVHVKRMHEWEIRWWIARQLIVLAVRIAWLNVEFVDIDDDGTR